MRMLRAILSFKMVYRLEYVFVRVTELVMFRISRLGAKILAVLIVH